MKQMILCLLFLIALNFGCNSKPVQIKVMTWNIWHGGLHGDKEHNFEKDSSNVVNTLKVIKECNPDILLMQETYCCGMDVAKDAGFKYSWRGSSNLSIHSKFPIIDTLTIFKPFNAHGVKIKANEKEILCFNIWLHYSPDYMKNSEMETPETLVSDEHPTRFGEIKAILNEISTSSEQADSIPVIIGGDFNSGSHLDWIKSTRHLHHGKIVQWPVSMEMTSNGFKDSYRKIHPDPLKKPAVTNRFINDKIIADRIDYIYFKGKSLEIIDSKIIRENPEEGFFNSDHRAVLSTFILK